MSEASSRAPSRIAEMCMWSARHRWLVALAWLGLVVAAFVSCTVVKADTDINMSPPGEAGNAFDTFRERFDQTESAANEFIVFRHPTLTVDDPAYQATVEGLMTGLRDLRRVDTETIGSTTVRTSTRIVADTTTHYNTGAPRERSPFVATHEDGGDVTFALVELEGSAEEAVADIDQVLDMVADYSARPEFASGAGPDAILIGGDASLQQQLSKIIAEDFSWALILNLPVTFLILILAFRAVVAAVVPLVLAFAAIITANGILVLFSHVYALSEIYTEMVLLMGLATGIDYSLFVVTRFRRERAAGQDREAALRAASATSGKAVAFAGTTVVLSIGGMFLVNNVIFTSLAIAAIVVVVLAIIISLTLLPALLAFLGDNIDRLGVPLLRGRSNESGGIWGRVTDVVLRRPALLAVVTLLALLALASPIVIPGFNLGFNGVTSYSDDAAGKRALLAIEDNFVLGLAQPAMVVVDAGEQRNVFAPGIQQASGRLLEMVAKESVLVGPDEPFGVPAQRSQFNDAGDTELIFIPINADSGDDRAIDAVEYLRHDLVPEAYADSSAVALVTGATAANIDFRKNIIDRAPFVFAFVLGLAFLVLLVMFRSIVIPFKAIILNGLSVGAAYGVLVIVFQEGWPPGIEDILGFKATGIVESWLPLFLFAILFGLSMDYHMFVLGRVKEAYEHGAGNDEAVSLGIRSTAGTITSAAAIMVAVFTIFAFTRDLGLKQFGVGLGVAVLVDATVIRSVLLPASMKMLGDVNWYLPSWLGWLPKVEMSE